MFIIHVNINIIMKKKVVEQTRGYVAKTAKPTKVARKGAEKPPPDPKKFVQTNVEDDERIRAVKV